MNDFFENLRKNLKENSEDTRNVIFGIVGAILVAWVTINVIFALGFFGLILAALVVIFGATRLPQLAWFWGKSTPSPSGNPKAEKPDVPDDIPPQFLDGDPEELESIEDTSPIPETSSPENIIYYDQLDDDIPLEKGCSYPRETPNGTMLLEASSEKARIRVKSAIRYWCWVLPGALSIASLLIGIPLGAAIGYSIFEDNPNSWQLNPVSYMVWGSIITTGLFIAVAVYSFFATRPWVLITIDPKTIRYGSYKFDRRYHEGMQIGYETGETELKNSFFDQSFGAQTLRLTYGPWGEDLPYLVNSYHAPEIVIWMNRIIENVGAPPAKRSDPYAGRKIELL